MSNLDDDLAFCKAELKTLNPIHHFTALTARESHRADLIAFYAFLAEIARIPRLVSEPGTGEIRLQWWIDVINSVQDDVSEGCGAPNIGPIAAALKYLQHKYALSAEALTQIVEARKFDLYHDPMPDRAAFETYAGETRSLPLLLSTQIMNDGVIPDISELCGNAGMAISLSNHLRRWAKVASYQQLFLPRDCFQAHEIDLPQIFSRRPTANLTAALHELMDRMQERHKLAMVDYRSLKSRELGHLAPVFLELSLVPLVHKKRVSDLYGEISIPNWRGYWSIWRMASGF